MPLVNNSSMNHFIFPLGSRNVCYVGLEIAFSGKGGSSRNFPGRRAECGLRFGIDVSFFCRRSFILPPLLFIDRTRILTVVVLDTAARTAFPATRPKRAIEGSERGWERDRGGAFYSAEFATRMNERMMTHVASFCGVSYDRCAFALMQSATRKDYRLVTGCFYADVR